jgi:hypothetical protein
VDITWDRGEVHLLQDGASEGDFLANLTSIGGHFAFASLAGNLNQLLPELLTVGGDLTLTAVTTYQPQGSPSILTGLAQVGGVFTLTAEYCGGAQFPSLAQVGGLTLSGGQFGAPIGTTSFHIGSSGVTLEGTTNSGFPFANTPNVSPLAPITMTSNASLCECQIAAFVQAVESQGWHGTLVDTGNETCPTGTPPVCPGPTCGSPGGGAPPG